MGEVKGAATTQCLGHRGKVQYRAPGLRWTGSATCWLCDLGLMS